MHVYFMDTLCFENNICRLHVILSTYQLHLHSSVLKDTAEYNIGIIDIIGAIE